MDEFTHWEKERVKKVATKRWEEKKNSCGKCPREMNNREKIKSEPNSILYNLLIYRIPGCLLEFIFFSFSRFGLVCFFRYFCLCSEISVDIAHTSLAQALFLFFILTVTRFYLKCMTRASAARAFSSSFDRFNAQRNRRRKKCIEENTHNIFECFWTVWCVHIRNIRALFNNGRARDFFLVLYILLCVFFRFVSLLFHFTHLNGVRVRTF